MTNEQRRVWLYNQLITNELLMNSKKQPATLSDYDKFYKDETNVKKLYDYVVSYIDLKDKSGAPESLSSFYLKYVCDLDWAKQTKYCPKPMTQKDVFGTSDTPKTISGGVQRGYLKPEDF